MKEMTGWETQGRTSSCQEQPRDCNACATDFEQTQQQVELLRLELSNLLAAGQHAPDTFRRALMAAMPARQNACEASGNADFHRGWNACLDRMEAHIGDLLAGR